MQPKNVPSDFLEVLARALHACGAPASRLEAAVEAVARARGRSVQVHALPTAIFLSDGPATRLLRLGPGEIDLGRLVLVDKVASAVASGRLTDARGLQLLTQPRRATPLATMLLAFGLSSAAAALLIGGGLPEVLAAGLLGAVAGAIALHGPAQLGEFLAALLISAVAAWAPVSGPIVTLASLIVMLPGFTMTVALGELMAGHSQSGTSRLANGAVTFLKLGVGIALGSHLAEPTATAATPLSEWLTPPALAVALAAIAVLFHARLDDLGPILVVGGLGFYGARLGGALLGPELGGGLGALAVGLASNAHARWFDRPASVTQTPAVLLLVPGSVGFSGLSALLAANAVGGVNAGFTMLLAASSLMTGLLVAHAVYPAHRSL